MDEVVDLCQPWLSVVHGDRCCCCSVRVDSREGGVCGMQTELENFDVYICSDENIGCMLAQRAVMRTVAVCLHSVQ